MYVPDWMKDIIDLRLIPSMHGCSNHVLVKFNIEKRAKITSWLQGGLCQNVLHLIRLVCSNWPRREVPEPADRRLQTRRMPLWNAWDCFITENLVLPVMYDSVHSVLVKQHGYIQWTNCSKNTLLGN